MAEQIYPWLPEFDTDTGQKPIPGRHYRKGNEIYRWGWNDTSREFGLTHIRSEGADTVGNGGPSVVAAPVDTTPADTTPASTSTAGDTSMAPINYAQPSDWSSGFLTGGYDPAQQYRALMAQNLGGYYTPQVSGIAQRGFEPMYGSYLLGGYGQDPTTTGMGTNRAGVPGGSFADWFTTPTGTGMGTQLMTPGSYSPVAGGLDPGWNLASQFGALAGGPDEDPWIKLASSGQGAMQMGESMRDPAAIRAMAMAQLYGGRLPASGWMSQRMGNAMNRFYNTWAATQPLTSETGLQPAGFIPYLAGLNKDIWGNTLPT
jgi:hypothetical protein